MVLLVLESTRLYDHLFEVSSNSGLEGLLLQFFHHPWHGLRFWDLIQPAFMFIAGTALAFSLHHQRLNGVSWRQSFVKTLKRSGWLFFWGVLDYAVRPNGLSFELWDVLTQLSFTMLAAFIIFRLPFATQIAISFGLLLLTEVLYRLTDVPGFDQPFTDHHNFGNYVDVVLMNKINPDGWVAINCIPTAAHTIWGALAGKLLLSERAGASKVKILFTAAIAFLFLGYLLDYTSTPIIKRIATTSFTLVSGGYCLIALALSYWWIDIKGHRRHLGFFTLVGMNSIFIYLFIEIVAARWFNSYIFAVTNGLFSMARIPAHVAVILGSLVIFALEWGMCWFLYRRNIFFRL
jgi:predicted acyltransferase